ncbi:hypothetical protein AB4120_27135 [Cupriavidus sp. 2KB_3]|uniref:hypothetical protein n=1 Tax=Cupriavidus sp. 2KB_3 TaxID=3232980 RepID=UPI003F8EB4BE
MRHIDFPLNEFWNMAFTVRHPTAGPRCGNKVVQRLTCVGDDDQSVLVLECRYFTSVMTPRGLRIYPGAKNWRLSSGELVELIDKDLFRIPHTGEILMRDG